jgi:uncharacterized MAPEG superfamily protein
MTIAYWCVLFAALLPIVWSGVAKAGGSGFDNSRPRVYLAAVQGWRQRANWAQQNAWEAFAPFAAGVVIATQVGVAQTTINGLALGFMAARVLHGVFYLIDQATLRSLVFIVGLLCTVGLFIAGA